METIKTIKQSQILKSIILAFIGTIILAVFYHGIS